VLEIPNEFVPTASEQFKEAFGIMNATARRHRDFQWIWQIILTLYVGSSAIFRLMYSLLTLRDGFPAPYRQQDDLRLKLTPFE
jgi:hypothetical protein